MKKLVLFKPIKKPSYKILIDAYSLMCKFGGNTGANIHRYMGIGYTPNNVKYIQEHIYPANMLLLETALERAAAGVNPAKNKKGQIIYYVAYPYPETINYEAYNEAKLALSKACYSSAIGKKLYSKFKLMRGLSELQPLAYLSPVCDRRDWLQLFSLAISICYKDKNINRQHYIQTLKKIKDKNLRSSLKDFVSSLEDVSVNTSKKLNVNVDLFAELKVR